MRETRSNAGTEGLRDGGTEGPRDRGTKGQRDQGTKGRRDMVSDPERSRRRGGRRPGVPWRRRGFGGASKPVGRGLPPHAGGRASAPPRIPPARSGEPGRRQEAVSEPNGLATGAIFASHQEASPKRLRWNESLRASRRRGEAKSGPPSVGRKWPVCFVVGPQRLVKAESLRSSASHPGHFRPIARPLDSEPASTALPPACGGVRQSRRDGQRRREPELSGERAIYQNLATPYVKCVPLWAKVRHGAPVSRRT